MNTVLFTVTDPYNMAALREAVAETIKTGGKLKIVAQRDPDELLEKRDEVDERHIEVDVMTIHDFDEDDLTVIGSTPINEDERMVAIVADLEKIKISMPL